MTDGQWCSGHHPELNEALFDTLVFDVEASIPATVPVYEYVNNDVLYIHENSTSFFVIPTYT